MSTNAGKYGSRRSKACQSIAKRRLIEVETIRQYLIVPGCTHSWFTKRPLGAISQRFLISSLFFNFALVTLITCGFDVEDPIPPDRPQWVTKSLPSEWPETGIDAHESGGIFLEWINQESDQILLYRIYRAEETENEGLISDFELIVSLSMESLERFQYIDTGARVNIQYYYEIIAEDISGNVSERSPAITYKLLPTLLSNSMSPNGVNDKLGDSRRLYWSYDYSLELERYTITLLDQFGNILIRENFLPGVYDGGGDSWRIPSTVTLSPGLSYKWRIDVEANYSAGKETSGSETEWAIFNY